MINILWNCALKTHRENKGGKHLTVFSAPSFLEDVTQSFSAFRRMSFARRAAFQLRKKLRRVLSIKKTSSVKLFSSLEHFPALRGGFILGRSVIVRSRVWPKNWAPCVSCLCYLSLSKMAWFQHLIISICELGQSFTFFLSSRDNPVFMIGRCLMRIGVSFCGFSKNENGNY